MEDLCNLERNDLTQTLKIKESQYSPSLSPQPDLLHPRLGNKFLQFKEGQNQQLFRNELKQYRILILVVTNYLNDQFRAESEYLINNYLLKFHSVFKYKQLLVQQILILEVSIQPSKQAFVQTLKTRPWPLVPHQSDS